MKMKLKLKEDQVLVLVCMVGLTRLWYLLLNIGRLHIQQSTHIPNPLGETTVCSSLFTNACFTRNELHSWECYGRVMDVSWTSLPGNFFLWIDMMRVWRTQAIIDLLGPMSTVCLCFWVMKHEWHTWPDRALTVLPNLCDKYNVLKNQLYFYLSLPFQTFFWCTHIFCASTWAFLMLKVPLSP